MRNPGIIALVLAYGFSQFFRSFLAVLSQDLKLEIGAGPGDLANAMGVWFLVFALMQIPVGWALDRIGPRRTTAVMFGIGTAGGSAIFALAQAPWHLVLAMGMIGLGCAPVLMASYYIFARTLPAAMFASLGAMVLGLGSLGNLAASVPMAWAAETLGWRSAVAILSALAALLAAAIWRLVTDPEPATGQDEGSLLDLLTSPALWLIFPVTLINYAPAAGIRGLWSGPYSTDIFGADAAQIGQITLVIAIAMIVGNFVYGPLDRVFRTRKWVVFFGNLGGGISCLMLYLMPTHSVWLSTALMAAIGFFGCSFAVIIAHGRQFFPPHLIGRGVTLLNFMGIAGVGLGQFITGQLHRGAGGGLEAYRSIFLFYAAVTAVGLVIYLFSREERF